MSKEFESLLNTIKKLRDPDKGCPWDLKQTASSLAPALFEECCECLDGVASKDFKNVQEELGDVIFTSSLMTYILEQEGLTTTDEILKNVNEKMIRRHPHVFGDVGDINTSEKVLEQWEFIKSNQEGRVKQGVLDQIPNSLPPLDRSFEIQKKVEKVGFDWENINDIFAKISEETNEVKEEIKSGDFDKLEMEIGDLLFSVVNLSRFLKINPSNALRRTNSKFMKRFKFIEKEMVNLEKDLTSDNFKIMDQLWDRSKHELT